MTSYYFLFFIFRDIAHINGFFEELEPKIFSFQTQVGILFDFDPKLRSLLKF